MKEKTYSYSLKVVKNNNQISTIRTRKIRRIYDFVQMAKKSEVKKYVICVIYGRDIDCFGKNYLFKNKGEYETKQYLIEVLQIFLEKGLWDET